MAVARHCKLAGFNCLDPRPFFEAAERLGTPDEFWGRANSVTCPIGFEAGSAFVLVDRTVADALPKNDATTIAWIHEGGTTVFSGYYPWAMQCVNIDGDGRGAYLVELRDARQGLKMSAINARFNCLKPLPYTLTEGADRIKSKYHHYPEIRRFAGFCCCPLLGVRGACASGMLTTPSGAETGAAKGREPTA